MSVDSVLSGNLNYLPEHVATFESLVGLATEYSIVRCDDCRFVFASSIPNAELLQFDYSEVNATELSRAKVFDIRRRRDRTAVWLRILRMWDREIQMRVVDFGCGWGDFLAIAKAPGVSVVGVEQNPRQVASAQAAGIDVIPSLDALEDGSADVVIANQVLEHVTDPRGTLAELRRLLRDSGIGYFSVPDFTRFNWARAKLDLESGRPVNRLINPWEHLNYFSRSQFRRVVSHAGFDVAPEVRERAEGWLRVVTNRRAGIEIFARRRST